MSRIYLDHAATSPLRPEVLEVMLACMRDCPGNASSAHENGRAARAVIDNARRQIAAAVGARPEEIFFTSGGTESDNWALQGTAQAFQKPGRIITSAIEHHAILHACGALARQGWRIDYLPANSRGLIDPAASMKYFSEPAALISVMLANNEIGTIQPIRELCELAHSSGALFHTDAVQALGSVPLDVNDLGVDLMSLSAHKFGGPGGVGALYVRSGTPLRPIIYGGPQERGRRAGTENTAAIAGMGKAAELACLELSSVSGRIFDLRECFINEMLSSVPGSELNGDRGRRLPGNANFCFHGVDGVALLFRLDMAGVSASAGSACTAGSLEPSHVLTAIGKSKADARSSIRFTLGRETTLKQISQTVQITAALVRELRADVREDTP